MGEARGEREGRDASVEHFDGGRLRFPSVVPGGRDEEDEEAVVVAAGSKYLKRR